MIQAFQSYIATNKLFIKEDRLLVAVSGGRDSMLLVDLLLQLGYVFGVAHVNYQLRGEDSEQDEQLVTQFCEKHSIPLFIHRPYIQEFKEKHGVSTQMAARTIRYEWFEEIRSKNKYQYILTAHHAADSVETILLHLTRGTGMAGLKGILPIQGYLRRPLLFATKEEIHKYTTSRNLIWREDLSNLKTDYTRNKMRLEIIPLLEQINPGFQYNLIRMAKFVQLNAQVVQSYMSDFFNEYKRVSEFNEEIIEIDVIRGRDEKELILFEWLYTKGFGSKVLEELAEWIEKDRTEAKFFYSATHTLLISRNQMLVKEKAMDIEDEEYTIFETSVPCKTSSVSFSVQRDLPEKFDSGSLYIDLVKVNWPLKLRKWKRGDKIRPFGMNGQKKISDILIDKKVPIGEKSRIFVLEDGKGEILWLIGKKQSDKARIYPNTQLILHVKYME